jgi:DNA-binding response OmpR family regulator
VGSSQRREAAILIVDDAPANLELLRKLMSEQGYQTYVATSGERALAIAQRAHPDLILLDVLMPDMDGIETCRLKQHPLTQRIPVIFMSAKTETEDVVAGFDCGAVDYISKPLRMAECVRACAPSCKSAATMKPSRNRPNACAPSSTTWPRAC